MGNKNGALRRRRLRDVPAGTPLRVNIADGSGRILGIQVSSFGTFPVAAKESQVGPLLWTFVRGTSTYGNVTVTDFNGTKWYMSAPPGGTQPQNIVIQLVTDPVMSVGYKVTTVGGKMYLQADHYLSPGGYLKVPDFTTFSFLPTLVDDATQATPISIAPDINPRLQIINNIFEKADDNLCQGSPGTAAQLCYYNHAKGDPKTPILSNQYPGAVLGFNAFALGQKPDLGNGLDLGYTPFVASRQLLFEGGGLQGDIQYLGPPTNASRTNNVQLSYSPPPDVECRTEPDGPGSCEKFPTKQCPDGNLSCLPGYVGMKFGTCQEYKNPGGSIEGSYQAWQCVKPSIVCQNQKCVEIIDGVTPSQYDSMKSCIMDCEPCPKGYVKRTINNVKGCYRDTDKLDYGWIDPCDFFPFEKCCNVKKDGCNRSGAVGWRGCCHGADHYNCLDYTDVPPYGFQCMPGPCWRQCDSGKPCPHPTSCKDGFSEGDDVCNANTPFCK